MAKSVGLSDGAFQYLKGYADQEGMTLTEAATQMVLTHRHGERLRSNVDATEVTEFERQRALETEEIDKAMGYERKEDEVTARDGLASLYAISKGSNNDMGVDKS
jgi:hypothetical protein